MSTHEQRRRTAAGPGPRVAIEDLLRAKRSMLGEGNLPANYERLESSVDVIDELYKPEPDERIARITIVWDNPVSELPLADVLDTMRQYGAAMVTKVEQVER
jgi:hypothetical protein